MGKEVGDFLSEFLHQDCRLVCLDPNSGRQIDTRYAATGELLSFADAFPFMIIGEASFADLNNRLSSKFLDLSRRFRPNLIFTGGMPYDEDRWDKIKIGNAIFSGRKNCGRCVMINLDPDAGMSGAEPLKTLSAFRKSGNSVLMGRHLCLDSLSQLSDAELLLNVGDLIEVISLVKD
jgi:uncharacterized protein YcbX